MQHLRVLAALAFAVFACRGTANGQDRTMAAFSQAMGKLIAAGSKDFVPVWGKLIADDRSGDKTYALTFFVPIFAACELHNDFHTPVNVVCRTQWNPDGTTVGKRYDQMVETLAALFPNKRDVTVGDCANAIYPGVRCFRGLVDYGVLWMVLQADGPRRAIVMRLGNY